MSLIQDINALHFPLKFGLFSVAILMPFWYVDIYLFANWYVEQNPIQLPIIISFCLSIGWLLLNMVVRVSFLMFKEAKKTNLKTVTSEQKKTEEKDEEAGKFWVMTLLTSIVVIGSTSFLGYIIGLTLFEFICLSFGLEIGIVILMAIGQFFREQGTL